MRLAPPAYFARKWGLCVRRSANNDRPRCAEGDIGLVLGRNPDLPDQLAGPVDPQEMALAIDGNDHLAVRTTLEPVRTGFAV